MAKNKKSSGFWWGLFLGLIIAAGAVYYYQNHYSKSDIKRTSRKLEKKAEEGIEKTRDGVKKLFEKE